MLNGYSARFYALITISLGLLLAGCESTSQSRIARPGEVLGANELPQTRTTEKTKDLTQLPRAIHMVKPVYPYRERVARIAGTVVLEFTVDTKGNVAKARAVKTPNKALGQAAVDALMKSKFTPGMKDGRPVNCVMLIPMTFSID